jgi:hypothetical protein
VGFADVLVFLVPALLAVNIQVRGRLYLSELFLLATLPFLVAARPAVRTDRWAVLIAMCGLAWLWAQIVTDLYRSTSLNDLARGWLNIAFTLIDFGAVLLLTAGRVRRIVLFTAGLAAGYALAYRFNPSPYADVDPWKFGVAIPVTLLIVLISCQRVLYRTRLLSSLVLVLAGIMNFAFGFRSLGGVCLLAAAYVAAQAFPRRTSSLKITLVQLIGLCSIGAACGILLVVAYGHAAKDGFLGTPAAQRYREESTGKFGVLLGGRPELFASWKAIADSPLIGHGSWAKDPKYTNELLAVLSRNGYVPSGGLLYAVQHSGYLIPAHSFLFQSWVEAGLLGAVFWFVVLAFSITTLIDAFRKRPVLSPLIAFLSVLLVWNIFFSPYGADQRIVAMFTVAALLACKRLPVDLRRERSAPDRLHADRSKLATTRAPAW